MGRYQKVKWQFQQLFAKKLSWQKEMEVAFETKDAFDWADLIKEILEFVEKIHGINLFKYHIKL